MNRSRSRARAALAATLAGGLLLVAGPARADSAVSASSSARLGTGSGTAGQTLTVTPATDLDPSGSTVTVTGAGFTAAAGFDIATEGMYLGFCVDNGPGLAPTPCVGGVDITGSGSASKWITNNPLPGIPPAALASVSADGSFTTTIEIARSDQFVDCAALPAGKSCKVFTRMDHRASGDRSQDVRAAVSFAGEAPPPTTPTTPSTPVTPTTPSTPTTPTAPSTPPPTTAPPVDREPSGSRTGTGPRGQTLTVTPVDDLDPSGTEVTITGQGFDAAAGFDIAEGGLYVAFCVDQGAGQAPSPCVGGVDTSGSSGTAQWVTNNPYEGVPATAVTPVAPDGSFTATITIEARDSFVDCLALPAGQRCVVATRADHRASADRTQDVKVPVCFASETACVTDPIVPEADPEDVFTGFLLDPPPAAPAAPSSTPALAATGASAPDLVPVAALLVTGGLALVLVSRRRRDAIHIPIPAPVEETR